jgi:hypothetical protein
MSVPTESSGLPPSNEDLPPSSTSTEHPKGKVEEDDSMKELVSTLFKSSSMFIIYTAT